MISIVIPILDEAETIGKLVSYLVENSSDVHVSEIIIVDGGSTDGSKAIVNDLIKSNTYHPSAYIETLGDIKSIASSLTTIDIRLIHSEKGRAMQMNAGAKVSKADILYFLHADSFPPKQFDQLISDEVAKGNAAGCFRMQFDSKHWWLCLASWLTQFSWRACRGGDQSQFITRQLFDAIGGYDERYAIYEDNVLITELYSRKQFVVINKKLKTSARRYQKHGIWKLQYHFWTIYVKKWCGANADDLLIYYKKHIC